MSGDWKSIIPVQNRLMLTLSTLYTACMISASISESTIGRNSCNIVGTTANCSYKHLQYIPRLNDDITCLIFEGNNLPNVTQETFTNVSKPDKMYELKFGFNKIVSISANALDHFYSLKVLDLSGNKIIAEDLKFVLKNISRNIHLRTLVLNDIGVDSIKMDTFSLMNCTRLQVLYLQRNNLTEMSFLRSFKVLKVFDISHNLVAQVKLVSMIRLQTFQMNHNKLADIPMFCDRNSSVSLVPNLQQLYINFNYLLKIQKDSLKCLENLKELEIRGNFISVLPDDLLQNLPSLRSFNSGNNNGHAARIEPYAFRSKSLVVLKIGFNGPESSIFRSITETFKFVPNLIFLEIAYINMIDMSEDSLYTLFSPLTRLEYFSCYSCQIQHDPKHILVNKTRLKKINLDKNYIENLSYVTFQGNPHLKRILLGMNKIEHLKQKDVSNDFLSSLDTLDLSNNQFICDCDLEWFITWLRSKKKTHVQDYPQEYVCAYPINRAGKTLSEVQFSYRECHPFTPWEWAIMISGPCVLAIVVISITLYRKRWNIKHYIYLMRKRRNYIQINGENLLYDAFVAYHQDNSLWVRKHLIPVMEEQHNLKLCIHERDFQAGVFINDNIVNCIEKSKKIILILSNAFSASGWCIFELKVAHSKHIEDGTSLVIILLESIRGRNMNELMKVLLETTTYIEWTEDNVGRELFWNKLRDSVKNENN